MTNRTQQHANEEEIEAVANTVVQRFGLTQKQLNDGRNFRTQVQWITLPCISDSQLTVIPAYMQHDCSAVIGQHCFALIKRYLPNIVE